MRDLRVPVALALLITTIHAQADDMTMPDMAQREMFSTLSFERLEKRSDGAYWEGQGWLGSDLDKLWLKTEGERDHDRLRAANLELLYSRAIAPYWDAQIGARHDFGADGRNWLAVALKGTAPYGFDVDASAYVGNGAAARIRVENALLLTQRLALLPELEANFYSRSDPAYATGAGLSSLDFSLRLRYEIRREFAPYIGIVWSNRYGSTAAFMRDRNESADTVSVMAGARLWW
ncbi:MAG: copper resistance protein B [Gallionellaceae bacterium]|jgi:copper resistance protein B|nr:copper resistance protein B [Gallionellaceae bacterium]